MDPARRHLRVQLVARSSQIDVLVRRVLPGDFADLSQLMFAAYRGSIDDDGESLSDAEASVRATLNGEHGDFLDDCSFVALESDHPVAATLVTMLDREPLLAQVYTSPERRSQGLGRALIQFSMNALILRGESELNLVVTSGNEAAERLYESLGFVSRSPDLA